MNNNIKLYEYNSNEYKIIEYHTDNHRFLKKIQIKNFEPGLKIINLIMFNPSPSDRGKICNTIKIILDYILKIFNDFGEINITNLFSYTDSNIKNININNIDYNNNQYLINEIEFSDHIILAYGDYNKFNKFVKIECNKQLILIKKIIDKFTKNSNCIDINKNNTPRHPSYYLRGKKIIIPKLINYNIIIDEKYI